jgi:hypothetical protein
MRYLLAMLVALATTPQALATVVFAPTAAEFSITETISAGIGQYTVTNNSTDAYIWQFVITHSPSANSPITTQFGNQWTAADACIGECGGGTDAFRYSNVVGNGQHHVRSTARNCRAISSFPAVSLLANGKYLLRMPMERISPRSVAMSQMPAAARFSSATAIRNVINFRISS